MQATSDIQRLNPNQRSAFEQIVTAIESQEINRQRLFFIDGPGRTGKSFLYNTLIGHVLGMLNQKIIVVASSGIAALLLHTGQTAHSTFKIPIPIRPESTCNIHPVTELAHRIRDAAVILWDEAPMLHRHIFEAVDRTIRDIMRAPDSVFGGKVVVFGGDFRQVLPVVRNGSQQQIEDACLKNSKDIWSAVQTLQLTENMRVANSPQNLSFIEYLLRVGEGREPTVSDGPSFDHIRIPESHVFTMPCQQTNNADPYTPEQHLIRAIYPDLDNEDIPAQFFKDRAILTTLNADVDVLNAAATKMLHGGPPSIYTSQDSIIDADAAGHYPPEFLNTLSPPGLPPHKLELKVGQPVILLRNMNPHRGMCNGTRLIIRQLGERFIEAEILLGRFSQHRVFISRIPLTTNEDGSSPVQFSRRQFPLKPAFAMTINKSQGQTLNTVGLYLPQPVFCHGQLYVALSRCTDPNNLKIMIKNGNIQGQQGIHTPNIVYKKVLTYNAE